jgi:flagellar biosynthesis GTPase FlhF
MRHITHDNTVDWSFMEKEASYTNDRVTMAQDVEKVVDWRSFHGVDDIPTIGNAMESKTLEDILGIGVQRYAKGRVGRVVKNSSVRVDVPLCGVPIRVILSPYYTYFGYQDREGGWVYLRNAALFRRRFRDLYPDAKPDSLEPPAHIKLRHEKEEEARRKHAEKRAKAEEATAAAVRRRELQEQEAANREKVKELLKAQRAKAEAEAQAAREAKQAEAAAASEARKKATEEKNQAAKEKYKATKAAMAAHARSFRGKGKKKKEEVA